MNDLVVLRCEGRSDAVPPLDSPESDQFTAEFAGLVEQDAAGDRDTTDDRNAGTRTLSSTDPAVPA